MPRINIDRASLLSCVFIDRMLRDINYIQENVVMKVHEISKLLLPIISVTMAYSAYAAPGDGGVDEFGMEDHSATCKWNESYQNLSVADFDGSGYVGLNDISLLRAAIEEFETKGKDGYQAFYDISNEVIGTNGETENVLDSRDLAQANMDLMFSMFRPSSKLDQEVAAQYHATIRYRDINNAILDGFAPFTQEYENHGIHLLKMPQIMPDGSIVGNVIDGKFDAAHPEGLNYDRYGNLVGVFYAVGPDLTRLMSGDQEHYDDWINGNFTKLINETDANGNKLNDLMVYGTDTNGNPIIKPIGFSDDGDGKMQDHWHFHQSMCERNAWTVYNIFQTELKPKAEAGQLTFAEVFDAAQKMDTRQCDLDKPCREYTSGKGKSAYQDGLSIPRFFMLHTWIYNANNRCGTMWGSHEDISYNDLNPDGTLTDAEIATIKEGIAAESLSFVLQAEEPTFIGTATPNKNYRKACLNSNFIKKPENYEQARAILRGEDVVIDGVIENYQTMGLAVDDIKETLICQPKITGEPIDDRCAIHPNDL